MSPEAVTAVAVGIPARDEETTIEACLVALGRAARRSPVPVSVVVVADGCTDRTAERAHAALRDAGVTGSVVTTTGLGVGRARALALETALAHAGGAPEATWLATTDADTNVDPTWLHTQLRWARRGYDGVAGLVGVDWSGSDPALPGRYVASLAPGGTGLGHGHVHGANLGVRASWWRAVGGCGPAACGEDRELWDRLARAGARTIGVDDLRVTTSGRLTSRLEGGFASYLSALC
ncbi:glycosyltransferase family 2 protein [Iamia sp. SCSIO 61187]|uniref:glycosyltransferase n=1 Tax=Iamia sp. SCSIO 61187 TaxID=2722752 RepID=UPI001C628017|nr:glycosyltransferase family 2 protein [Iamia sp. SCSIO 61187]QYG91888.1 glycosyltransferase family 2 protein [Iamia sp. SCSIO 61187]